MEQQRKKPSYMVIGNGAVGTAIAARLFILDKNPVFVGRKGPVAIKSRFEGWGKVTYLDIKALSQADVSKVALVFVTVKAYDLAGALERYLSYIPKGVPVIPLSNGAIEEIVLKAARKHPDYKWRLGLCNFGVSCLSDGIYSLRSKTGRVIWGPLERRYQVEHPPHGQSLPSGAEEELLKADKGNFFQWQPLVIPAVRRKWLYNVVINSMTAALALERNGELLNDMKRLHAVYEEAYRLGQELWGPWERSFDKLLEELVCLISATSDNENSMARDVRMGRRTENEFLAKLAEGRRGYDQLHELSQIIDQKTKSYSRREPPSP